MKSIHAVYEQGVFRPLDKVELPERTPVEFELKVPGAKILKAGGMDGIYKILSERYRSGEEDVADRHNEHQP